jgi:hypothetical protein
MVIIVAQAEHIYEKKNNMLIGSVKYIINKYIQLYTIIKAKSYLSRCIIQDSVKSSDISELGKVLYDVICDNSANSANSSNSSNLNFRNFYEIIYRESRIFSV